MSKLIKRLPDSELEIMMIIWEANEPVTSAYISEKLKDKKEMEDYICFDVSCTTH